MASPDVVIFEQIVPLTTTPPDLGLLDFTKYILESTEQLMQRMYELGSNKVWYIADLSDRANPPVSPKPVDVFSSVQQPADRIAFRPRNDSFVPSPPSEDMVKRRRATETQVPNKMAAADPRWGNKVAWSSNDLLARQKELATYSVEVAMVFEAIRITMSRILKQTVSEEDLEFIANFGSPVVERTQRISIKVDEPISVQLQLTRTLEDGKLRLTMEAMATLDTPLYKGRTTVDVNLGSGNIPIDPIGRLNDELTEKGPQDISSERKRRKVRL
jgi:hypothetical protein